MNLLAHGYLSTVPRDHPTAGLMVGNFLGDFIKGAPDHPRHHLQPEVVAGVRLHRIIDAFTDSHPDVALVRDLLHPRCHKYAGVAVDVFFDHFLARQFTALTGLTLAEFIPTYYQTLQQHEANFPEPARRMLSALITHNWLPHYATFDGVDRSLRGIARRTQFPSGLDTAVLDLEQFYEPIGEAFSRFWPQLVAEVARFGEKAL